MGDRNDRQRAKKDPALLFALALISFAIYLALPQACRIQANAQNPQGQWLFDPQGRLIGDLMERDCCHDPDGCATCNPHVEEVMSK